MLKQIKKKSDKTYLVSADQDTWVENNKIAAHMTPSKFNDEKSKLLINYSENELETKLSNKRDVKFTDEDKQILIQELESLRNTNKFARIIKK